MIVLYQMGWNVIYIPRHREQECFVKFCPVNLEKSKICVNFKDKQADGHVIIKAHLNRRFR